MVRYIHIAIGDHTQLAKMSFDKISISQLECILIFIIYSRPDLKTSAHEAHKVCVGQHH